MASPTREPSGLFTNSHDEIGDEIRSSSRHKSDAEATLTPTRDDTAEDSLAKPTSPLEKPQTIAESAKQKLHLQHVKATGPGRFFNPTNVQMHIRWHYNPDEDPLNGKISDANNHFHVLWRSRDNRKGRNSVAVPTSKPSDGPHAPLQSRIFFQLVDIGKNIVVMLITFPYWDMAFWSGWSYSIGSALFVIDGFFSWMPIAYPGTKFAGKAKYGVPLCFFVGAMFYQIGAVMAYLEAVNDDSFAGSAMKRLLEGHEQDQKNLLDEKLHAFFGHLVPHRHKTEGDEDAGNPTHKVDPEAGWKTKDRRERPGSIYPSGKRPGSRRGGIDLGPAEEGDMSDYLTWRWWPTWHALRTHHIYEIGYLACAIQLFGVTLYGITAIVVLPGILDSLQPWQQLGAYWGPQVVAASCFLIASLMFTFETQEKWYRPESKLIGWWIGVWAAIGSVGFVRVPVPMTSDFC